MKHGADIYSYAKQAGCNPGELIDFSSNVNLHAPAVGGELFPAEIVAYPDATYGSLKEALAARYALMPSQIALFNGATAAIEYLCREVVTDEVYLYAPLYGEYEASLRAGVVVQKIDRLREEEVVVPQGATVIFVNPATPDGRYYDMRERLVQWMARGCTIIVDESFLEFEQLPSLRHMVEEYDKLYIVQSFSKFYACAGVRIGAIFSSAKNILNCRVPLWNISALDASFLRERVRDEGFREESVRRHRQFKEELFAIMQGSGLFEEIYPSDANFFLARSARAQEIFSSLLQRRILVRRCESFDFLDGSFMRFAVKNSEAHHALRCALAEVT
jgi:threonine-phosphate decarboxylase